MKRMGIIISCFTVLALLLTSCGKSGATTSRATTTNYKNPAVVEADMQRVTTQFSSRRYSPITVQVGLPVRWTIQMDAKDLNSCNNALQIPKFDIQQSLSPGETVIEFTPTETGNIPYSCWMGMIRSTITVVDSLSDTPAVQTTAGAGELPVTQDQFYPVPQPQDGVPTTMEVAVASVKDGSASVNIQVTNFGYLPNVAIVQKGMETSFEFDVTTRSCAQAVLFPQYETLIDLTENNTVTVTPTEDFTITCFMGMYGIPVLVVEDINSPEVAQMVEQIQETPYFNANQSQGCCGSF